MQVSSAQLSLRSLSAGHRSPRGCARLGKGRGRHRLSRRAVRMLGLGEPRPTPSWRAPCGLASNCGKTRRPREGSTCGGRTQISPPKLPGPPRAPAPAIPDKALKRQESLRAWSRDPGRGQAPARELCQGALKGGRDVVLGLWGGSGDYVFVAAYWGPGDGTGLRQPVRALPSLPSAAARDQEGGFSLGRWVTFSSLGGP